MAAELDLDGRRKPTQQVTIALRHEERGLGEVVLGGDRLHRRIGQPFPKRADRRRVAAKQAAGESIDLIEWDAHDEALGLSTSAHPDGSRGARQTEERMKATIMVPGAEGGHWMFGMSSGRSLPRVTFW